MDDFNGHDMNEFYAWNGEPTEDMLPVYRKGETVVVYGRRGPIVWLGWSRKSRSNRYGVRLDGNVEFFDEDELRQ